MSWPELKSNLKTNLFNVPGWRTDKRLIIFESDDWGNIRIPSIDIYDRLLNRGINISLSPFRYDSLENEDDIANLAEVLRSKRNVQGNAPKFTINNIVANPDFERIEEDNFTEYYNEDFTKTYSRYNKHSNCMKFWAQGTVEGLFLPQLHGREHLNIRRWMHALRSGQTETKWLFEKRMFALDLDLSKEDRYCFNKALDVDKESDKDMNVPIIEDACKRFERIWGYKTKTFIAPNYTWDEVVEWTLFENNVMVMQGMRVQFKGDMRGGDIVRRHYMGQRNRLGQVYLTRNCYFEPSQDLKKDWVSSCLKEIASAFFWKKPAIVCTHRVNYVGGIKLENRDHGLLYLSRLLSEILKRWPDAEFITSDQLGDLMTN